jgi:DNA-binding XRE family transcriptional regulator
MHTTRQLATNAQSHTPVVAVSSAPPRPREQKCTRSSCWFMHGNPATRYFQMVVMIMVNKKLREHRQRAGIPLEILAYKARVSPRTLWRWERWNCTPRSWESIQRVAAVLGVQPEDLLDDEQGGER